MLRSSRATIKNDLSGRTDAKGQNTRKHTYYESNTNAISKYLCTVTAAKCRGRTAFIHKSVPYRLHNMAAVFHFIWRLQRQLEAALPGFINISLSGPGWYRMRVVSNNAHSTPIQGVPFWLIQQYVPQINIFMYCLFNDADYKAVNE